MDMRDQSDSDLEDDSSVILDIPEEDAALCSGSESGELDDNGEDSSLLDDLASHQAMHGGGHGTCDGNLPDVIFQLKKQLLNRYTLPPCPAEAPLKQTLSRAETLSLQHYFAWIESHGTVRAYNAHARVLADATKEKILSLHKVSVTSRQGRSPDLGYVDFRMTKHYCQGF
jgi:hypothetical protein